MSIARYIPAKHRYSAGENPTISLIFSILLKGETMRSKVFAVIASALLLSQAGVAGANEASQDSSTVQVADASAPLPPEFDAVEPTGDGPTIKPQSADGTTWAPGGFGAANTLFVTGRGTWVDNIAMAYNLGANPGNACVDKFEIAYREKGQRKVRTSGPNCALYRTTHTFQVKRHLDPNTKVCGRAHVRSAGPGNWACITIKP